MKCTFGEGEVCARGCSRIPTVPTNRSGFQALARETLVKNCVECEQQWQGCPSGRKTMCITVCLTLCIMVCVTVQVAVCRLHCAL